MTPKPQDATTSLDRQESVLSTTSFSSQASSIADFSFHPLEKQKSVVVSSSSSSESSWIPISINLLVSLVVFWMGFYNTHLFLPSHDHVYDRTHPYQTTSRGDVILSFELNHPLIYPASVPSRLLHQTCVYLPLLLIIMIHAWSPSSTSWKSSAVAISGLLAGLGICEVSTHILKYYVLRRRPNFYALCGWDGQQCTAASKKILESQLSFPSGHSSIGWCGMTFLVLVLLGKTRLSSPNTRNGWCWWKPWATWAACLIPLGWAAYVAASRIADKWHHASDVVSGTLIGVLCATVSYHSIFPHVLSVQAGTSYAELAARKSQ